MIIRGSNYIIFSELLSMCLKMYTERIIKAIFQLIFIFQHLLFLPLDAADDRVIFGSDLGAGYPYTDLVFGVPDMNGQLLYAGMYQPENISKFHKKN